jgi:hypothetical protein
MATDDAAPAAEVEDNLDAIGEALMGLDESSSDKADDENEKISDNDETSEAASDESEDADEDVEENKDDDESDKDEDDEEGDKDDDATVPQEKIQKRIDKLTAQKKEALEKAQTLESEYEQAKTRLTELEAQANEASRPVLQPSPDNPLANVNTFEELDAKIKSAQEVRQWAMKNNDGATVKRPDGTEVYVDADKVKEYLLVADNIVVTHAPERQRWLAERQPALEATKTFFPDILKKGTPLNEAYLATVKRLPELLKSPQNEYWVGLALYGEQTLMAKQEADKAKSAAAKKVSSKKESKIPTPASPVSAAKSATKTSSKDAAKRVFEQNDSASLEAFAESLLG